MATIEFILGTWFGASLVLTLFMLINIASGDDDDDGRGR